MSECVMHEEPSLTVTVIELRDRVSTACNCILQRDSASPLRFPRWPPNADCARYFMTSGWPAQAMTVHVS